MIVQMDSMWIFFNPILLKACRMSGEILGEIATGLMQPTSAHRERRLIVLLEPGIMLLVQADQTEAVQMVTTMTT